LEKSYNLSKMKEYEEPTDKLKRIYQKVVKNFPEIEKDDIRIEFERVPHDIGIAMIDYERYEAKGEVIRDPTIYVGLYFFGFKEKEMEAAIAHELGHYMHYKNFSTDMLRRLIKWVIASNEMSYTNKRIQKWSLMDEIYADEQALKAGYGKPLISSLKHVLQTYYKTLPQIGKKELNVRIENLEKKVENI